MYLAGPLLNWKVHVHAQKYLLWGRMRFIDPPASNIASEGREVTVYIPHTLWQEMLRGKASWFNQALPLLPCLKRQESFICKTSEELPGRSY